MVKTGYHLIKRITEFLVDSCRICGMVHPGECEGRVIMILVLAKQILEGIYIETCQLM